MTDAPQIRPGELWLDTDGARIQAHAGSIIAAPDGTFVWYGENKERTTPGSPIWHWGVRAYSSRDLVTWEDRGLIIPPDEDDPASPLHPEQMMDRPHIVQHPETGQYVCWVKVMHADGTQKSTVLVADDVFGPYRVIARDFRPLGMNAGDFDLVVDPTDGKAYYYFERVHSELICADLTADYRGVTGYYSTHFPRPYPPFVREAPAYFRRGAKHYLLTSGTTGYYPNPSEAAVADTYHGPWAVLGDPHVDDLGGTSHRSQISSVFRHPGKRDLYIALADRWRPDLTAQESHQSDNFAQYFSGGTGFDEFIAAQPGGGDARAVTALADYVWLPIEFDGDRPLIRWRDAWHPDDFD